MSTDAKRKSRYRSRPVSRQPSDLLVGASISTQLRNSSYGRFHEYLSQSGLQAQLQHKFQLPCVIAVGGRSAGKSSLLEAITKCPIFPRHRDFCTKMPIELHMKNDPTAPERRVSISYPGRNSKHLQTAQDILKEVSDIMQSVTGIDSHPIIITICQADVPTFTFVDLPGIQTYPEEQEKATSDLVNTYLSRPSTLVLCVVDATTAAFDTSVALKLIRRAGKLSNTIVAMTKSDLVTEEDEYVPKIFDRILGESSDSEHLRKLAGCVAVANRQQRSNVSLADADAAERKVFSRTLHNPAEAFAPPAVQQQLQESMTITQLIVQLDRMFHSYIVQHWKPAALEKLGVLISTSQEHLQQLGPPVEELTADGKMAVVWSKVHEEDLCRAAMLALVLSTMDSPEPQLPQNSAWGSLSWVDTMLAVEETADKLLGRCADIPGSIQVALLCTLLKCFNGIFSGNPEPKLQRFSELHRILANAVLPEFIANFMAGIQPKLQQLADATIAELYYSMKPEAKDRTRQLKKTFQGFILSHFIRTVRTMKLQPSSLQLPQDFVLAEDADVQQERAALIDEAARLQVALLQMSCIEDAFTIPGAPLITAVTHGSDYA